MDDDRPSTSGMYQPGPSIDQDKIVFAFEREYFQNFGQSEPQRGKGARPTTLFNPFQNGLQLRDQELVDFLNERLGDHEETWAGKNVAAFLSREMIEELETCFQGLEPIAKLKIVLGFSQLSTKRLHDWRKEINTLLEIAAQDPDDWVEAISDNFRIFSPTGIIELEPTRNMEVYRDSLGRIYRKLLEYANRKDSVFCNVPDVYHYCDEKVIENELNFTPRESEVHFTVKKKLKADLLREEILNELKEPKQAEDKNTGLVSSLPMKYRSTLRKPDLKTPMRGIVQPNAMKINGGFTSEPKKFPRQLAKRDGGSLLISIDDIPHAHQKRKKDLDREEREKKREQAETERKRVEAEKRNALIEKANQKKKEAEKLREEATRRKEAELTARSARPNPLPKAEPSDPAIAFSDPSLELERLRHQQPSSSQMEVDKKQKEKEEAMDTSESDKAVEWMFHHDEVSQSKIGDTKEDDYEFLNRPRPAGLESRETIIQKTTTEVIDTVTCCTLEQQRQIVAFMSGNKSTYRPMLGNTNCVKISDSMQQGIVDDRVCRVRVESFIHMNFDSGEWKKQQRCKVLAENETPRDYDGRQCPRLTHQQIFNEIARNLTDEPEDKRFAGESVIVRAYVPAKPNVELKLSDDTNKLLSPTGSSSNSDVLYGQEVTAGEMITVLIGISGCVGMRTVVGKANLLSPTIIVAAPAAGTMKTAARAAALQRQTVQAAANELQKIAPRPAQQPHLQPATIRIPIDQWQIQQMTDQFPAQAQGSFTLQQSQQQQQQQQRLLAQPRHQTSLPTFAQNSLAQTINLGRPINNAQSNQAFFTNQFANGQPMLVNMSSFNLVPQTSMPSVSMQQVYQIPQNPQQNVSYQFQNIPNQDQQQQQPQQFRY
ncbi:hypothetical protein PENTCL1PPCAC_29771 [Pristionchus entomophagus]|uniref:HDAg domain-containing protein n=1 Tax=Pristionchus entomophagus TaxID=358040 RepID=A0AAV5UKU3_9BILA|nr:hypothetical protein PENTCL1PPCAC_29771 [Pristionchus entomophagus]